MSNSSDDAQAKYSDLEQGFAEPHDVPVPYMYRTQTYYRALGYPHPYRWAQYTDVPFTRLPRPLRECRVALVTTAAPFQEGRGGPGCARRAEFARQKDIAKTRRAEDGLVVE